MNEPKMTLTDYHAKYLAWRITHRRAAADDDRIAQSLFDASVDLNPHQIDAALFALNNPLSKGVVLADEVGLGKTIEAALVLCQLWAERRRRLVIVCPAALRKQWANELKQKFNLPSQILDARTWDQLRKQGFANPLAEPTIHIMSFHYAAKIEQRLTTAPWDLVVIDEAHKLRNAHRDSNVMGQAIKRGFAGSKKLLLTATPLQNSLLELYGLSTVIDEHLFGDRNSFQRQYVRDNDIQGLKKRTEQFTRRTLRQDVLEYVRYTKRHTITQPFSPSEQEQQLYDLLSGYLTRPNSYGFPQQQRHLISLVARKLLASSTAAVIGTLEAILKRLEKLQQGEQQDNWLDEFIQLEDLEEELLEIADGTADNYIPDTEQQVIDTEQLRAEIAEVRQYIVLARSINDDEKAKALVGALKLGFEKMASMGAARKVVIFTESRRSQTYLANFLERNGFQGKVLSFNGSNNDATAKGIYQSWLANNQGTDQVTGSPAVDRRTAIIDGFKTSAEVLIATEAAAEGVNLQFCSLLVNYDLPWNPQRVEQRIGRCHRYGQKHDVVVINFLNQRNAADRRVLELLTDKFQLFEGLFGASDTVIGRIEGKIDIEKRIAQVYEECRTPDEINAAFDALQKELEDSIAQKMQDTEDKLLQHFDHSIHDILKTTQLKAEQQLDTLARNFWRLSCHQLRQHATFDQACLSFHLESSPQVNIPTGHYILNRSGHALTEQTTSHHYRLTHPLGEYVLDTGRRLSTAEATLQFQLSNHQPKVSALEPYQGQTGWLQLNLLQLQSFELEEHMVFSALSDQGEWLPSDVAEQLFLLNASVAPQYQQPPEHFAGDVHQQIDAALNKALEKNNEYFQLERTKLEQWAEDQEKSAQGAIDDIKAKIKETNRAARQANTVEEQAAKQDELKKLEKQKRRLRQELFDVEDAIAERRDALIDKLQKQMNQQNTTQTLFTLRWQLV